MIRISITRLKLRISSLLSIWMPRAINDKNLDYEIETTKAPSDLLPLPLRSMIRISITRLKPLTLSFAGCMFQSRSMIRISITRLKPRGKTLWLWNRIVTINDKNLDYEIETPLPRFGLDLVGLEGWKEKEGWKDGGNQSSSLAIFQSSNDQSKESRLRD